MFFVSLPSGLYSDYAELEIHFMFVLKENNLLKSKVIILFQNLLQPTF